MPWECPVERLEGNAVNNGEQPVIMLNEAAYKLVNGEFMAESWLMAMLRLFVDG